jgi:hypothetical protein
MEKALKTLKLAMGIVLLGGGAAFTGGTYAAQTVANGLEVHSKADDAAHAEDRAQRTAFRDDTKQASRDAAEAKYESQYTRMLVQQLLLVNGVTPKPAPPKPADLDGGGSP